MVTLMRMARNTSAKAANPAAPSLGLPEAVLPVPASTENNTLRWSRKSGTDWDCAFDEVLSIMPRAARAH